MYILLIPKTLELYIRTYKEMITAKKTTLIPNNYFTSIHIHFAIKNYRIMYIQFQKLFQYVPIINKYL